MLTIWTNTLSLHLHKTMIRHWNEKWFAICGNYLLVLKQPWKAKQLKFHPPLLEMRIQRNESFQCRIRTESKGVYMLTYFQFQFQMIINSMCSQALERDKNNCDVKNLLKESQLEDQCQLTLITGIIFVTYRHTMWWINYHSLTLISWNHAALISHHSQRENVSFRFDDGST